MLLVVSGLHEAPNIREASPGESDPRVLTQTWLIVYREQAQQTREPAERNQKCEKQNVKEVFIQGGT